MVNTPQNTEIFVPRKSGQKLTLIGTKNSQKKRQLAVEKFDQEIKYSRNDRVVLQAE